MKIPNIFFNTKSNYKYSYYELGSNNKKGSYLEISINENTATIEVDRYSSIPIYYIIFKDCLYASTKIDSLINSAPSDFKLEISSLGISTFIKTNTLMDNLTFFNNIKKIPYGCKLVFNKKKKNTKILKHWNL